MDEEKYTTNSLYMPSNVPTEKEILPRISNKNIKYFSYLCGFGISIGIIISIFISFQVGAVIAVPIIIFSYLLCARNPVNNYSTISQFVGIYNYFKKQNKYIFKYTEWWEKYLDEEKETKK